MKYLVHCIGLIMLSVCTISGFKCYSCSGPIGSDCAAAATETSEIVDCQDGDKTCIILRTLIHQGEDLFEIIERNCSAFIRFPGEQAYSYTKCSSGDLCNGDQRATKAPNTTNNY